MYLDEYVEKINNKLKLLKEKKNIVVWGAAENTVRFFQYTDIIKYNITTIVDKGKTGQAFFGRLILSADKVFWNAVDAVLISSYYRENEIYEELTKEYNFAGLVIRLGCEIQKKPFYQNYMRSELQVPVESREEIKKNIKFHNLHKDERIFVIGNGPSIRETDLTKIEDAKKMVVSNFYLHKDYKLINPDYYCIAQLTYTDHLNTHFYNRWLSELAEKSGNPQFIFNISEKNLIDSCGSFANKTVNYMYLDGLNVAYYDDVDMTGKMMMGVSVPVDCIQIALYMGFKEIYLVGIEHDSLITYRYDYFYERSQSLMKDTDPSTDGNGSIRNSYKENLYCLESLWRQYEKLKEIAEIKGVKIYNATKGGCLDVFERVEYDSIY